MELEPLESSNRHRDPVVSDVNGRLWRVRARPGIAVLDVLLGVFILTVVAVIAAALLL